MNRQPLVLIAAIARDGVIGRGNALPWRIPEDLRHFRTQTVDHAVIMGRKTFESMGRALPERRNIVVTRDRSRALEGCESAASLEEAIAMARCTDPCPYVIGGSVLYASAIPLATELVLTEIDRDYEGDVKFPAFDRAEWRVARSVPTESADVKFVWYERIA
ncbi:MAG: dihydrofolate reductase [Deltaproteobacteria bacterium]|nr:dihydrofolate reductase [Deltaproteobacteria bacterium]